MIRKIVNVTPSELQKAAHDLVNFNEFTFYGERDTDECTGLTFALEFLFCSLGLNDESCDSAELMQQFVLALDDAAMSSGVQGWDSIRANLPFSRCLN